MSRVLENGTGPAIGSPYSQDMEGEEDEIDDDELDTIVRSITSGKPYNYKQMTF
jgi:hypothetical protein